jgi:hypothetical protein
MTHYLQTSPPETGAGMSEVERLRDKVEKCRQLAAVAGDVEIERMLIALADKFEAGAVRAGARANCEPGRLAEIAETAAERRKLALTNFNRSW